MAYLIAVTIIIVTGQTESSPVALMNSEVPEAKNAADVCNTDTCKQEAKVIESAINVNIDPCEDFYGFVCKRWITCNPIPDNQGSHSLIHIAADRVLNDLGRILNTTTFKCDDQNATDKALIYYQSCLREGMSSVETSAANTRTTSSVAETI